MNLQNPRTWGGGWGRLSDARGETRVMELIFDGSSTKNPRFTTLQGFRVDFEAPAFNWILAAHVGGWDNVYAGGGPGGEGRGQKTKVRPPSARGPSE